MLRSWSPFKWPKFCGGARLAVVGSDHALETSSRRGEVVRLGPQHVRAGHIRIERTHGSRDVDIPMSSELQAACAAMSKAHLTFITTAYGKPRSKFGLGNDFAKWATEAGLPTRCRLHRLKKSGMRRLAEDKRLAANDPRELAPEQIRLGDRVIYQWCPNGILEAPAASAFVEKRLKLTVTARNWNTVVKLAELLDE